MKLTFIFPALLFLFFSFSSFAQSKVVKDTLIVKGICGMCKERIEEAAYGKGVKFVSWDKITDQLVLAYRSDKTSISEIEERIVKAGHSTNNREVSEKDYAKLPDCCRYEELHDH